MGDDGSSSVTLTEEPRLMQKNQEGKRSERSPSQKQVRKPKTSGLLTTVDQSRVQFEEVKPTYLARAAGTCQTS